MYTARNFSQCGEIRTRKTPNTDTFYAEVTLITKFRKILTVETSLNRISMTTTFLQDLAQKTFNKSIRQNKKLGSLVKNDCLKSNLTKITPLFWDERI